MKKNILTSDFINPGSKKFCTITYKDHDAMTCNPGVIVSDWSVVREIEKRTTELQREGRNMFIYVSKLVVQINGVQPFGEELKAFEDIGFTYDPWLIW